MSNVFVYVEGKDDQRFLENILSNYENLSADIIVIPYQQKTNKKIADHIRMIKSKGYDFLFLSDLDSDTFPCITKRKEKRVDEYSSLNSGDIVIVNEEIESWFLAGIDDSLDTFQGFDIGQSTENISKEDLDKMIDNSKFDSKIDFMNETAKYFDFNLAISRNNSFKYFLKRLDAKGYLN